MKVPNGSQDGQLPWKPTRECRLWLVVNSMFCTITESQYSANSSCDIKKQLRVLDTTKVMGADSILAIVLQICFPQLAAHVAKLFQLLLYCHLSNNVDNYPGISCTLKKKEDKFILAHFHLINLLLVINKVASSSTCSPVAFH